MPAPTSPQPFVFRTTPGTPTDEGFPEHIDMRTLLEARDRSKYRNNPLWRGLRLVCADVLQGIEDIFQDLRRSTTIIDQEGSQLDQEGDGLGLKRDGMGDDPYRASLTARWMALYRKSSIDLVFDIMAVLVPMIEDPPIVPTWVYGEWNAYYYVFVFDTPAEWAELWHRLIRFTKPPGIRFDMYVTPDLANAFRFDSGPGFDQGHLAWVVT